MILTIDSILVYARYIFPTLFAKTSCMMNPLLYGLTNASLRQEFCRLWRGGCRNKMDNEFDQERAQSRRSHASKYVPLLLTLFNNN